MGGPGVVFLFIFTVIAVRDGKFFGACFCFAHGLSSFAFADSIKKIKREAKANVPNCAGTKTVTKNCGQGISFLFLKCGGQKLNFLGWVVWSANSQLSVT